jgi:parallel beta-helix repeat protein
LCRLLESSTNHSPVLSIKIKRSKTTLNDVPRQKLIELIEKYGPGLAFEPKKVSGLLFDLCGEYRKEIRTLVYACEEHVPDSLVKLDSTGAYKEILIAQITKLFVDNSPLSEEAASWAVETWALALRIVSSKEQYVIPDPEIIPKPDIQIDLTPIVTQNGPELTVSKLGLGQYKSITEALQVASPGTRIMVKAGVYKEALRIDKPVEIIGAGQLEEIVIEAQAAGDIVEINENVKICNLVLRGKIYQGKGQLEVEGCHISGFIMRVNNDIRLILRSSKIGFIFCARSPENMSLSVDQCDIQSVILSSAGDSIFKNSSIAKIYVGLIDRDDLYKVMGTDFYNFMALNDARYNYDQQNQVPKQVDYGRKFLDFDTCRIGCINISFGKPKFTNCSVNTDKEFCVKIFMDGSGMFQNCNFGEGDNCNPIIAVLGNGIPVFKDCKIHGTKKPGYKGAVGIIFGKGTKGFVENCEIYNNYIGVEITRGGNPTIRACTIYQNDYGISIQENGAGIVEDCNLRNNKQGAWKF